MASTNGWVDIRGAEALGNFATELRAADREIANAFRRDMRKILKPAVTEAKKHALLFPAGGSAWRTSKPGSFRKALMRSVDPQTKMTSRTTRISVRSSRTKFEKSLGRPAGSSGSLHAMAAGEKAWRHPRPKGGRSKRTDWGNWYGQTGHNWLEDAVRPMTDDIVDAIEHLMGEYARVLADSAEA